MKFENMEDILSFIDQENTTNDEKWLIPEDKLDETQYKILHRKEEDFIVSGCAGSGKTILAIYKVKNIILEEKGSYLFIVFTKVLKDFIRTALENDQTCINNINVFYKEEFKDMKNKDKLEKKYDYIILDEVQDFEIEFIKELKNMCTKQIICLGDDQQQLYSRKNGNTNILEIAKAINIDISNIEYLNKNYRVSKSIAEFAGKIIDDNGKLENSCVNDYGIKPIVQKFNSLYEQLDYIKDYIDKEEILDVAILVHRNCIVEQVVEYLRKKNLSVEYKFDMHNNINFNTNTIKVLTYHSSKGVEFENVFLPCCEVDDESYDYKKALYVACTRAKKRLVITYSNELSPFIKN